MMTANSDSKSQLCPVDVHAGIMVGDGYGSARAVAGFMKRTGTVGSGRRASVAC